jgi:hypothetical protein
LKPTYSNQNSSKLEDYNWVVHPKIDEESKEPLHLENQENLYMNNIGTHNGYRVINKINRDMKKLQRRKDNTNLLKNNFTNAIEVSTQSKESQKKDFEIFNTERDLVKMIMDIRFLKEQVEKLSSDKQVLKFSMRDSDYYNNGFLSPEQYQKQKKRKSSEEQKVNQAQHEESKEISKDEMSEANNRNPNLIIEMSQRRNIHKEVMNINRIVQYEMNNPADDRIEESKRKFSE